MIQQLLVEDFSEYVQVASSVRPTYYKRGNTRIPKMYQKAHYEFREGKLFDTRTESFVIANRSKAGKPRYYKVNGQDLYNGRMHHATRSKIVSELHKFFAPYVVKLPVFTRYPIEIHMEFRIRDEGKHNIDNDNKWLWQKAFTDTLTLEGKIIDDSPRYVCSHTLYTSIIEKTDTLTVPELLIDIQDCDGDDT